MADSLHPRRRYSASALLAILTCSIAALLPAGAQEVSLDPASEPVRADAVVLAGDASSVLLAPANTQSQETTGGPAEPGVIINTTPNDITVDDGVLLTITSLTDITGIASATHVVRSDGVNDRHFAFEISGASGSLRAQGGIQLGTTTVLTLNESVSYSGAAGGRLSDTASLQLDSATLQYINTRSPLVNLSETIGTLRIGGFSTLALGSTFESSSYGTTTLMADSLARINRGTFQVTFTKTLGSGTASAAYVRFANAPATSAGGVVPYATAQIASESAGYGVVVYEAANGLRQLSAAEYTSTFTGITSASHLLVPVSTTLTNSATLTLRSLTMRGGSLLNGSGLINVASGLVLHQSGDATIDNYIAFGNQEAFIAVPTDLDHELTFQKPVTGSGGLTIYGRAIVAFDGGNQISGDLVFNGSARVRIGSLAELGPATTAIQVNGLDTGAGIRTTATFDFTRQVQVNSGYFSVSPRAGTLTLNGGISGAGGLFVRAGTGNVLLAGTNTYAGPTMVEGNLSFLSDAAFGNSNSIILYNGTLKLLSNWTTNRKLDAASVTPTTTYLDTNGFDADLQGNLTMTGSSQTLVKTGAGRLLVNVPWANTSPIRVTGGQMLVQGNGSLTGAVVVANGAALLVDNTASPVDRGTLRIFLGDGEYKILGSPALSTTIHGGLTPYDNPIDLFNGSPAYGAATFVPAGSAPIILDLSTYAYSLSSYAVVRGGQLAGGPSGAYTRIRFSPTPALVNGILPHLVVDASASGFGTSFTTYDTASDAAGAIGVRALKASEYANTAQLGNPANGGGTATTANFLASGVVSVAGAANTLSTLTLAPGSRLDLGPKQRLNLGQNVLLVQPGAIAEISGGIIAGSTTSSGVVVSVVGGGDLRLGSTSPYQCFLYHLGPGLLLVTGRQSDSGIVMWSGTLQAGPGNPLINAAVSVNQAAHLDLLGATTRVGTLGGTGTVNFANGTLQVEGGVSTVTFAGPLAGNGTFISAASGGVTLSGSSPFTGTLSAVNGGLTISGTLPSIAAVTMRGGTVVLDNLAASSTDARLGTVPLDLSSGTLNLKTLISTNTAATFGTLTGDGLSQLIITNNAAGTATNEGRLTFANLVRRARGEFSFSTVLSSTRTGQFDFVQDLTPLLVGDPAVAASRPVLPYAILNGHPATFEPGVGLRLLTASEQVATFTAGQNVKISTSTTLNTTVAVNSFELTNSSILSGSGTLTVTSGLAVVNGPVQVALDFGAGEGHIFIPNSIGSPSISGRITGSNGLTISNLYNIALSGTNSFTGPLTINGAKVTFKDLSSLGADTSPVVLAGGHLIYDAGAGNTYTLTRGLDLQGSGGHVVANPNYQLTASGPISGPGNLYIGGSVTLSSTANSYTGTTYVGGTLRIASDANLGQSPLISSAAGGSTIMLTGNWTTSRAVDTAGTANMTVNTAGFDAALNGPITGSLTLAKQGAGTMTLTEAKEFTGPVNVQAGTVRLATDLGDSSSSSGVTVAVGARLEGSSAFARTMTMSGTVAPGVGASEGALESGNLTMSGGSRLELEAVSPSAFDQLRVNGTVTFGGLVELTLGISGLNGSPAFQWPILLNDGTDAITVSATKAFAIGTTPLTEGAQFNVGGFNATITYKGGDGNDVYVTVPEPGCAALGALGLLGLLARRPARRRGQRAA
jgi:fibronectin-binding autotransporter adhesin